jgi:hypothetical protein
MGNRHLLDERTADHLLSGVLAPEDAPPGFSEVAALLAAVRQPPTPQELAACSQTVVEMAEHLTRTAAGAQTPFVQGRRRAGLSRLLRPRIAATLTAGALALFGGLASADALPNPLQHFAHVVFGAVGIHVPDSSNPAVTSRPGTGSVNTTSTSPLGSGARFGSDVTHSRNHPNARDDARSHHHSGSIAQRHRVTRAQRHGHHARTSKDSRATKRVRRRPTGTDTESSDTQGDEGLCTAWQTGDGEKKGRAFRRLKARADRRGETVGGYCEAVQSTAAADQLQNADDGVRDVGEQGAGSISTNEGTVRRGGSSEESMGVGHSVHHGRRGGGEHDGGTSVERAAREIRTTLDSASSGDAL